MPIIVIGLLWFGLYNVALNEGERSVDAGTAAMLIQVSPVLIALLAAVFLDERFTLQLGLGLALAFGGVALISLATSEGGNSDVIGVLLCLVSAVAYSISLILQKPLVGKLAGGPRHLAGLHDRRDQLPAVRRRPRRAGAATPRRRRLWWLVYLGVFPTAIAFTTYAFALKHMSASNLGVTTYLVPPITIVMGVVFLVRGPARRWRTPAARSPWSASPSPAASPPQTRPDRRPTADAAARTAGSALQHG